MESSGNMDDDVIIKYEAELAEDTSGTTTKTSTVAFAVDDEKRTASEGNDEEKKDDSEGNSGEDDKDTPVLGSNNQDEEASKKNSEVQRDEEEMIAQAMTLDVAYQSLESVRVVNLQVEFGREVEANVCVPCLRAEQSSNIVKSKFGKWMSKKTATPCLTCGTPVCKVHSSSDFWKQNITICSYCAHLFSMNYLVTHIMKEEDPHTKKKMLNDMLEVYDRALLVLKYSTQFITDVVQALKGHTSRHNKIGLGSSATGIVAGGLGVAAACTFLTPVGPPLLLASILFGSGATAVNAGSEAVNYRSEPNKMADRILTLHSIISSIAQLPARMDIEEEKAEEERKAAKLKEYEDQSRLHWTRTAMNGLKPLTAGALSAISIVTEAREMKNAVEKIRAGNPCEKAERLEEIQEEIKSLPRTEDLSLQLEIITTRQEEVKAEDKNIGEDQTPEVLPVDASAAVS